MALYRLTNAEMVDLSGTMTESGHPDHQALMGQPELAAMMPAVADAHNMLLLASQNRKRMLLAPISDAQAVVDTRHDWLARAVKYCLQTNIALARARGDHALADNLERIDAAMFPDGLNIVNASYREEAGHARVLGTVLTAEVEATLGQMPVRGGALLDLVREWMAAAQELGELENQRVGMLTEGRLGEMNRARLGWCRVIGLTRQVVTTLEIAAPGVIAVMDRITRAERVAERRSLLAGDADLADEPAPDMEPIPDGDPDGAPDAAPGVDPGPEPVAEAAPGGNPEAEPATMAGQG